MNKGDEMSLVLVLLAPVHKVLDEFSVGSIIPIPEEANDSRVIRELV